jgi:hypothetical protein
MGPVECLKILATSFFFPPRRIAVLTEGREQSEYWSAEKDPQDDHNLALCVYQLMEYGGMEMLGWAGSVIVQVER